MWIILLLLLLSLVAVALREVGKALFSRLYCPRCKRELDPNDYRGFLPGQDQFCPYCKWEERDNEYK